MGIRKETRNAYEDQYIPLLSKVLSESQPDQLFSTFNSLSSFAEWAKSQNTTVQDILDAVRERWDNDELDRRVGVAARLMISAVTYTQMEIEKEENHEDIPAHDEFSRMGQLIAIRYFEDLMYDFLDDKELQ